MRARASLAGGAPGCGTLPAAAATEERVCIVWPPGPQMFPRRLTVPHYTFLDTNYTHLLSETKLRTYGEADEAPAPDSERMTLGAP